MEEKTARVLSAIKSKYGVSPEFLWADTPDNSALRNSTSGKWFGALLMNLPLKKLGLTEGTADILNLKCEPPLIPLILNGESIFRGYHMNKEHWISVIIDRIDESELFSLIDLSYTLTTKKVRK